jgi:tRNA (uracil-5-)-methyltransferase TRM9
MQPETIARLNTINRDFYATIASDFSATRGRAWQGWLDLLPYLPQRPLRVLDVGCGNGRWGVHLAENERLAHYHGIDNNATLLAHAQDALMQTGISAQFNEHDAIIDAGANLAQVTQDATYDVVGVFGVLHHVPSSQYRLAFMQALAQCVAQGGLLVVATWRFWDFERFRARHIPWQAYDAEQGTQLASEVERGDYLLDWRRGERALRYCHHTDDAEQDALCQATGLTEIARYRADGQDNRANCYSVLRT